MPYASVITIKPTYPNDREDDVDEDNLREFLEQVYLYLSSFDPISLFLTLTNMTETIGVQFGRVGGVNEGENCAMGTSWYRQAIVGVRMYQCSHVIHIHRGFSLYHE